ncbi:MAG: biopolymer transporter ExbD [Candidatus Firestonebacteria bacterium]
MAMSVSSEEEIITGINVTPLVDVCLVLVIIFMVTAPLMIQPILKVILPKATTLEGEEKENITITISEKNEWALNEETLPSKEVVAERLLTKIKGSKDRFVIIRADQNALYGTIEEAMSISKKAGAKKITIATEQKRR